MADSIKRTTPLVKHNAETESFKRPDHPDFWDAAECKKNELSGVRKNDIGLRWEFWILGNLEATVSFSDVAKDPYALTKKYVDIFYMTPEPGMFTRNDLTTGSGLNAKHKGKKK